MNLAGARIAKAGLPIAIGLAALLAFGGASAETYEVAQPPRVKVHDPLAPMNRAIYHFNKDFLDKYILIPIIKFHNRAIPRPARISIRNFFENIKEPVTAENDILQGRFVRAGQSFGRFGINTTVGIVGLMDVAEDIGLPRHEEDFGETLGTYGVGQGPYLVLPVLGSSSVRDLSGRVVDDFLDPLHYVTFRSSTYYMLGKDAATLVESRAHKVKAKLRSGQPLTHGYEADRDRYLQAKEAEVRNEEEGGGEEYNVAPPPQPSGTPTVVAPGLMTNAPVRSEEANAVAEIKDQFDQMNMEVTRFDVEGNKLTVELRAKTGTDALPCDEIWNAVNFSVLPGVNAVSVQSPGIDNRYVCTKFLDSAPPAGAPAAGSPIGLPGT